MNFFFLIALVFCKSCTLPAAIPEGMRAPSVYASYYTSIWAAFNCGYPGGLFWKSVSRKQLSDGIRIATASVGKLVTRPAFENALVGYLKKAIITKTVV
jgi:hypothetical protein